MSYKLSEYDLNAKTKPQVEEKINTKNKYYFPAKIGKKDAERLAESKKTKIFDKGKGLVNVAAVSFFYEPFILAEGKADLDYLRRRDFEFYCDETVHSAKIGDAIVKPVKADVGKKIKMPGVERVNLTRAAKWLFNPMGGAQPLESIPSTGKQAATASWLNQHKKEIVDPSITPEKIIKMLRDSLAAKPNDANRMLSTSIKIDLTTYLMPAYYITYKRETESKAARIDGVSGEITF